MQNIVVTFLGVVPLTGTPSSLGNNISIRLLRWCCGSVGITISLIIRNCNWSTCRIIGIRTRRIGSRGSWIIIFWIGWSSSSVGYRNCCTSIRCCNSSCCIWISGLKTRIMISNCISLQTAISIRSNMTNGCRSWDIFSRMVLINCSCFWQIVIWYSHSCNLTLLVTYWCCLRSVGLLMS